MRYIEDAPLKEPDEMGIWDDHGDWIALPQSRYSRSEARMFVMKEAGVGFTEVRVLSRWMRYTPVEFPTLDNETYIEDRWEFCEADDPNAFKVWYCE